MDKKIIGIFVCTLLIATIIPVMGIAEDDENNVANNLIKEGCHISPYIMNDNKCISNFKSDTANDLMKIINYENGDEVDQQQTECIDWYFPIFKGQWIAQSFAPSLDIITRVELLLYKWETNVNYDLTVSIKKDLKDEDLTSVSLRPLMEIYNQYWIMFDFTDMCLEVGKTYYIVCSAFDGISPHKYYGWGYNDNNQSYPYGEAFVSLNQGADWDNIWYFDGCDLCFKTYGIPNSPPLSPARPSGSQRGATGIKYTYSSLTNDPDGDQVRYKWDWGDETSGWDGPYDSGDTVTASHIWDEKGDYNIKVKAKDVHGAESEWSDPLAISMPKNKAINPFTIFLERLMQRFPILEQILQPIYDKLTRFKGGEFEDN